MGDLSPHPTLPPGLVTTTLVKLVLMNCKWREQKVGRNLPSYL